MTVARWLHNIFQMENHQFVLQIYRELLNRDPALDSLEHHTRELDGGVPKFDVMKEIVYSREFEQLMTKTPRPRVVQLLRALMDKDEYAFVTGVYKEFFNRAPEPNELTHHVDELLSGVARVVMLRSIILRDEVKNWLSAPMEHPRPYLAINEQGGSIITFLHEIFQTDNTHNLFFVSAVYRELLNRSPDPDDMEYYTVQLTEGKSKFEVMKDIVMSPEFEHLVTASARPRCVHTLRWVMERDFSTFVTDVYWESFGRAPDGGGFQNFVNELLAGVPKLEVLRKIFVSDEAKDRLSSELWVGTPLPHVREKVEKTLREGGFPYETILLVKGGGLGDVVHLTPVAKALKRKYPTRPIIAVVEYFSSVLKDHPYIDGVVEYESLDQRTVVKSLLGLVGNVVQDVVDLCWVSRSYGTLSNAPFHYDNAWHYQYYPQWSATRIEELGKHVCDLELYSLGLEAYATSDDVCVTPENVDIDIEGEYVVVCDTVGSFAGNMKRWIPSEWEHLIDWLLSKGITPVQLGPEKDPLLSPRVKDLRGKTTPRQAAGYLQWSRGYIGVEGGLFHLAKASGAPTVVIFSTTPVTCYAYSDTYVVTRNQCPPCWWTEGAWMQAICLKGRKFCMNLPNWEDVASAVSNMLARRSE